MKKKEFNDTWIELRKYINGDTIDEMEEFINNQDSDLLEMCKAYNQGYTKQECEEITERILLENQSPIEQEGK